MAVKMIIIDVTTVEFIKLFNEKYGVPASDATPSITVSALNKPPRGFTNLYLIVGGILSICAAVLHIAIIVGGPEWYRFFGAGESMAVMAHNGYWYPAVVTFLISIVLFTWGLYAFSGAGLLIALPFLKPILIAITTIYMIRGVAIFPAFFIMKNMSVFMVWSSFISLIIGLCYVIGTYSAFKKNPKFPPSNI